MDLHMRNNAGQRPPSIHRYANVMSLKARSSQRCSGATFVYSTASPRAIGRNENTNYDDSDVNDDEHSSTGAEYGRRHHEASRVTVPPSWSGPPGNMSHQTPVSGVARPAAWTGTNSSPQSKNHGSSQHACADPESYAASSLSTTSCSASHDCLAYDASDEDSSLLQARHACKTRRKLAGLFSKARGAREGRIPNRREETGDCGSFTESVSGFPYKESTVSKWPGVDGSKEAKNKCAPGFVACDDPWSLLDDEDSSYFQQRIKTEAKYLAPSSLLAANSQEQTIHITSFRKYYFRPVTKSDNFGHQACPTAPLESDFPFLRKSRYLEKMVKEYALCEAVGNRQITALGEGPPLGASSGTASGDISSLTQMDPLTQDDLAGLDISTSSCILNIPKLLVGGAREANAGSQRKDRFAESVKLYERLDGLDPAASTKANCHLRQLNPRARVNKKPKRGYKWLDKICMQVERSDGATRSGNLKEATAWAAHSAGALICHNRYQQLSGEQPTGASSQDYRVFPEQVDRPANDPTIAFSQEDDDSVSLSDSSVCGEKRKMNCEVVCPKYPNPSVFESKTSVNDSCSDSWRTQRRPLAVLRRKALSMFTHSSHRTAARGRSAGTGGTGFSHGSLSLASDSASDDAGCGIALCFNTRRRAPVVKRDMNRSARPLVPFDSKVDMSQQGSFSEASQAQSEYAEVVLTGQQVGAKSSMIFMPISKTRILGSRTQLAGRRKASHSRKRSPAADELHPDQLTSKLEGIQNGYQMGRPKYLSGTEQNAKDDHRSIKYKVRTFLADVGHALWNVKIYILRILLLTVTVSGTLFCIGWVLFNGSYY
ncbi:hypothetical protein EGW08_020623, partial [Elysia chlorotica]